MAVRTVSEFFGHTLAVEFGRKSLRTVRQAWIEREICRSQINKRVGRVVRAFKWAVAEGMIPVAVHQALQTLDGLRRGRSAAIESVAVGPAPDAHIDAVRPHVSRQIWAMIELQRLPGMRPGEACLMRTCDIGMGGAIWIFSPADHKTAHHGRERRVYIGPRAQKILQSWLRTDQNVYLFSPVGRTHGIRRDPQGESQNANDAQPSIQGSSRFAEEGSRNMLFDGELRASNPQGMH